MFSAEQSYVFGGNMKLKKVWGNLKLLILNSLHDWFMVFVG